MKISFVIPCYNSEKNIHGVLEEIRNAMSGRPEVEYEVVLVNDCSKDRTADIIKEIAHEDPHVIAVDLAKNAGQPNALLAGFNHVSGDYIMTSDDDGQTPVGRVFDFLDEINKGYDLIDKVPDGKFILDDFTQSDKQKIETGREVIVLK